MGEGWKNLIVNHVDSSVRNFKGVRTPNYHKINSYTCWYIFVIIIKWERFQRHFKGKSQKRSRTKKKPVTEYVLEYRWKWCFESRWFIYNCYKSIVLKVILYCCEISNCLLHHSVRYRHSKRHSFSSWTVRNCFVFR